MRTPQVITPNTPYKLAEIIRDTWPQLYYLKDLKKEKTNGSINTTTTEEGMVRCP
jgi:hypothetical protein